MGELFQALPQLFAVLAHPRQEAVAQPVQHHVGAGADHRVAPEGGTVGAGAHAARHPVVQQDRADGQAAAQALGQGDDVGAQVVLLTGQEGAGAAHAGLHLIHDQHQVPVVAQRTHPQHKGGVQGHHAPLALDQLQHDGAGVLVHQLGQGVQVPGGRIEEAVVEGPEKLMEPVLAGGGQSGQGAAMEAVLQGDDLVPAGAVTVKAVFARSLDGALVGLGPRVAKEHLVHAGAAAQALGQL